MRVTLVDIADFRCYEAARLELPPGTTVVVGQNGQGKTSLLEAIAWGALGRSFRGVPDAALVRTGAEQAIVRLGIEEGSGRERLIEAELRAVGRNRVLVDRNPLARNRDLLGALRVTVFAPDDLELVKGGPSHRRTYLDDLLVATSPRYAAVVAEYEKVLRHRNALLRGGMRGADARSTLDVFDEQLTRAGTELVLGRLRLTEQLAPAVDVSYRELAGESDGIAAAYVAEWADGTPASDAGAISDAFHGALARLRQREIERGTTLVGPHRDEWRLLVAELDSRTHASQGEQRTLALALRLAGHRTVTAAIDDEPVLLLDDVFSELDDHRGNALVARLTGGQTLVTTAGSLPPAVEPAMRLRIADGRVADERTDGT
jgi:DNA replication and repair protein RecF